MAKSLGGALAAGQPVVFTISGRPPEVMCQPGKELEALELLDKMGLIKLLHVEDMVKLRKDHKHVDR